MSTIVHFIDVGQGNMVLIQTSNGLNFVFDCNITDENSSQILDYVYSQIRNQNINAFIASHRDADHIRGVKKLHSQNQILLIKDSDYPGTTTNSTEYMEYMDLRRKVGFSIVKKQTRCDYGQTRFRYLSAQDSRLIDDANGQGIVLKVEHFNVSQNQILSSCMLPGDSDARTWRDGIMKDYSYGDLRSSILMGGHHGSISFFDTDPNDRYYFESHIEAIKPAMSIISVGSNPHGHPEAKAIELYEKHSTGSNLGNKILRTDKHGNIKLELKDDGGWNISKK